MLGSMMILFALLLQATPGEALKPYVERKELAGAVVYVGSKDKTLKLYEGHYHDLLNDVGKEGVMADITAWIGTHLR